MFNAERIQVASFVRVEVFKPHHAGDSVDSVGDVCGFAASEFFATTTHGYNSRERIDSCGESKRHRTTAAHLLVGDAGLDPTTFTM